jgi:hypothetical protein
MERELKEKWLVLYALLVEYFKYLGIERMAELLVMVEILIARYAAWADEQIRLNSLSVYRQTKSQFINTPMYVPPQTRKLTTLSRDVTTMLKVALLAASAGTALDAFRKNTGLGLVWTIRAAKTAEANAKRDALLLTYNANPLEVEGWIWVSALLPTTCMACIAMHGTKHSLTERLNDHESGYCMPKPIIRGKAVTVKPGAEWFANLKQEQQVKMMGPSKWDAWKAGKFDLQDLVTTYDSENWGELIREQSLIGMLGEEAKRWYRA